MCMWQRKPYILFPLDQNKFRFFCSVQYSLVSIKKTSCMRNSFFFFVLFLNLSTSGICRSDVRWQNEHVYRNSHGIRWSFSCQFFLSLSSFYFGEFDNMTLSLPRNYNPITNVNRVHVCVCPLLKICLTTKIFARRRKYLCAKKIYFSLSKWWKCQIKATKLWDAVCWCC